MPPLRDILRSAGITHPLESIDDYPHIPTLTTPGNAAVPMWKKLRSLIPRTALWPVVLGPKEDALDTLAEAYEDSSPAAETLKSAAAIDVEKWFQKTRDHNPDLYSDIDEGPWTPNAVAPQTTFVLPFDPLTHNPHPEILLALVPAKANADLPAYLAFGAYNDCPETAVHVAFARRWHQRYGAEIICISQSVIEMTIPRPPTTRQAALILAREQFIYCPDIVDQGVETISNLAATLLNADKWYFWWD